MSIIPVLIVGAQAEPVAETLEAGALVLISGKLTWKPGKSKPAGQLVITAFGVEIISPMPASAARSGGPPVRRRASV